MHFIKRPLVFVNPMCVIEGLKGLPSELTSPQNKNFTL